MRAAFLVMIFVACGTDEARDVSDASADITSDASADVTSDASEVEVFVNPSLCPNEAYLFGLAGARGCGSGDIPLAGIECRYPARGCTTGALPDNVCHCTADGNFYCGGHLRSCLPFGPEGFGFTADSRPGPTHRPAASACTDPASVGRLCAPSIEEGEPVVPACATDDDCAGEGICLGAHVYRFDTSCGCFEVACEQDDDCGAGALCQCGSVSGSGGCNGPEGGLACAHQCLPASCRTDADCGSGGLCSPSPASCGHRPEQWACHYAGRDECLTDRECRLNRFGQLCRFDDDKWACGGDFCVIE